MYQHIAPAKINLFLHLLGQNHGGYHQLESGFVFTQRGDQLTYEPQGDDFELMIQGPFSHALKKICISDENLISQAHNLFCSRQGICPSGRWILEKNLPVFSGIGSGSTDGAAFFHICRQWMVEKGFSDKNQDFWLEMCQVLGADVKACFIQKPSFVTGIGNEITPCDDFGNFPILLVYPDQGLCTSLVFQTFHQRILQGIEQYCLPLPEGERVLAKGPDAWMNLHNDLYDSACHLYPVIGEVKNALQKTQGCYFARMSGSGPTCFALYECLESCQKAGAEMKKKFPSFWIHCDEI